MGLDIVEMFMAIEEAFDVSIPDEIAQAMTTPGLIHDYLVVHCKVDPPGHLCAPLPVKGAVLNLEDPQSTTTREQRLWFALVRVIAEQLGLDESEIHRDANFVDDLGVD